MALIGYARVSSDSQKTDRQMDALENIGCSKIFSEEISGVIKNRPELLKMMDYVREGDTLVVESISRLGRSTKDLLKTVDKLQKKGVQLKSLKESIDTTTPQGRFVLTIFTALSELERETTRQRQREGIDAAQRRGKHMGRPKLIKPENFDNLYALVQSGQMKATDAFREMGISKTSFYKLAKQ